MIRRIVGRLRHEVIQIRQRLPRIPRPSPRRITSAARAIARASSTILRELRLPRDHRKVRIGVDVRPFYEPLTGVGWYLFHLLEEAATFDDIEIVCFGEAVSNPADDRLHVRIPGGRLVAFEIAPGENIHARLLGMLFPALIRATRCDVMFGANYFLPRPLDAVASRRVVTVHDLTYRRFPDLLQTETLRNLEQRMLREVTRADRILCVSTATREDLLHYYQADPARVETVLSGLTPLPLRAEPVAELTARPYILFVSTIEPRKDLPTLIEAFERTIDDENFDGDLVVVGKVGWKSDATVERMKRSRHAGRIHHLDYLSRAQLATVYARASMFVLPSIYEGFGFPLLEAMSFGVPSIASRSSSLPEVGGNAALYFPVGDAAVLAHLIGLVHVDEELRMSLSQRGRERAASFTWRAAARSSVDAMKRVARSA